MRTLLIAVLLLSGCGLRDLLAGPDEPLCSERVTAWPDADGDGLGETTDIYVGCTLPSGWVTNGDDAPADTDSGADSGGDTAPDSASDTDSGAEGDSAPDSASDSAGDSANEADSGDSGP